ncbi:polysialic acid transport protein KpsD [Geobacter sp. OR-1]|uniref:SLBB domain-containing protein n=1 Tax=Geobacter sp. OR-1 TaxID=1266765 RepID=UPI0005426A0C|nr:SLBB domain-containing protein [Geobacter sp. OR-1]GAM10828.1 polysialic acid transport protein KpsD [Geobacter sp. OR-1]
MTKFRLISYLLCLLFLISTPVFSAQVNNFESPESEGVYTGEMKMETPLSPLPTNQQGILPGVEDQKTPSRLQRGISPLDNQQQQQGMRRIQSLDKITVDTGLQQKTLQKKPKIILKAVSGDSMVSLSWKVNGLTQKPGDQPARFTIYYGIESGRYDNKVEVGPVSEHKFRFLRNKQIYYFKVQGTVQTPVESTEPLLADEPVKQELIFFSNEERVLPVSEEEQGSLLERSFASKTTTLQDTVEVEPFIRTLKQFGYEFFKNSLAASTPLDNAPVGEDYVLGPGDSLRIDLWGSIQGRYELVVDRNGEITLPRVGTVKVWGAGFGQAKEMISKAVSRYYKGYELNVSLGRLRSIQVFVVGEVESPGAYSVTSTATVINALALAGGPSKSGSLRNIRLSRGGKAVRQIDLYEMFLAGDRSNDVRLENGDTIFVPVIGPVAAVAGEVRRPAIFELKNKTSLGQLLEMAGGPSASGDQGRLQIERFDPKSGRVVSDLKLGDPETAAKEIMDRDMVKLYPVMKALRQVVTLQGNVARPGEYQFKAGMRVSDLIPSFTAVVPDAYLDAAQVTRIVPPDFHRETIVFNLSKVLSGDEKENVPLHEQDTVKVFSRQEMVEKPTVSINGMVVNPGTYDYYPNMTIRDLVAASGSLKRNAYMEKAELTRIILDKGIARAERVDVDLAKAMAGDSGHNLTLKPDDVFIVRGVQEWLDSSDRFINVQGEVRFPGIYSVSKGEKLSSILKRAGGYTDKAYLKGARFFRKTVQKDQQKRMDEIILRSEQDIMKKQGELASVAASREELEATKAALEGLQKNLDKLKTLKAEGRIVIAIAGIGEFENSPNDVEVQGGDVLDIPPRSSVVNIMGQVYNQTSFIHKPGEQLSYYLEKAGGTTRDAEGGEMYIIRADGSVFSRQQSSFGIKWDDESRSWTFGSFMATPLQPGDTLVVPQKLERTAWLREIKDITQILANVALTAGTVLIGLK